MKYKFLDDILLIVRKGGAIILVLSERQRKILEILLNEKLITSKALSNKINYSSKTVRKDIKEINEWLENSYSAKIKMKSGVGVFIEISKNEEKLLIDEIEFENNNIIPSTKKERVKYIIKKLLQVKNKLTTKSLAKELYVSKTTINNDLQEAEEWFKQHNISIEKKPNWGIKLNGKEKDLRYALSHILSKSKSFILDENGSERLYIDNLDQIREIIDEFDLKIIEDIIRKKQEKYKFKFTDEAYSALVIHIAIALKRVKTGRGIKKLELDIDDLKTKKEFKISKEIIKEIGKKINFDIPDAEIYYVSLHILGAKVINDLGNNIFSSKKLDENNLEKKWLKLSRRMIIKAENFLNINLKNDEELLKSLSIHLRSATNRLKHNMNLFNPILKEIKKEYSITYESAEIASLILENEFNIETSKDEIGFIAMHFQAAIERKKVRNNPTALLVCSTGKGSSKLLSIKLKNKFKNLNVLDNSSIYDLKRKIELFNPDLIITTISIDIETNIPIIQVNPILLSNQENKIKNELDLINNNELNDINFSCLLENLHDDLIFINYEFDTRDKLLGFISDKMKDMDYVGDNFYKSLTEREELASTYIDDGISIPHGIVEGLDETIISFCKLKEPIIWEKNKVDLILLFAINISDQENINKIFEEVYSLINDKKKINRLKKAKTKKEITSIISKEKGE